MSEQYTEQEVRDFYKRMNEKDSEGYYNVHLPTWDSMIEQHPNLCVDLEVEYRMKGFERRIPCSELSYKDLCSNTPHPTTEYVKTTSKSDKVFPWGEFLCGWSCGTLFWVGMNYLFGG